MTIRNFDALFRPSSIAIIGASDKPQSVGGAIARNVLAGGFAGEITFVNQRHQVISGEPVFSSIAMLPATPDLAVVAVPPTAVAETIADLGARGCRAAIVISASAGGNDFRTRLLAAAAPTLLRILGPNCLGFQSPALGLNASFAHIMAKPGRIALVSQSGAVLAAMLDWAGGRGIGFSHVVSLGEMADIDFGDILDFLALDPATDAILLYIENVTNARKFMSAGRIASRAKPVVVVKAGRSAAGARAAATHTGALAGSDLVYDAAFRRAGMLRVLELEQLFDAAEILAGGIRVKGNRLAILTNGGGAGVLAADTLADEGGTLATLSQNTIASLDKVLPATWSRSNPVDIIGDAAAERYRNAFQAILADDAQDAVLVINCPTGVTGRLESARAIVDVSAGQQTPVITCWLGEQTAHDSRRLFSELRLPTFSTPTEAVRAFMHLAAYNKNQALLMQTPETSITQGDRHTAKAIISLALAENRKMLTEPEAKAILSAYGIPTPETRIAFSPEEAAHCAEALTFPVVVKLLSPDISHKSDVGGVHLGLPDRASVIRATTNIIESVHRIAPHARISGFTVQAMISKPNGFELLAGFHRDHTFGPVILFGAGGITVEIVADRAAALPPLNSVLIADLIRRTAISKLLAGFRGVAPANLEALERALLGLSQIIADHPEISALDINPLLTDAAGVIALDARIELNDSDAAGRMAIVPYPDGMAHNLRLPIGQFHVRPIRPEDETALVEMTARSSVEDMRMRFLGSIRALPQALSARLSQIDYDREMALVAINQNDNSLVAVCRILIDPNFEQAEYAIMVRTDLKENGLGRTLTNDILDYARKRGVKVVWGDVLASNSTMIQLAEDLGAALKPASSDPGLIRIAFHL